MSTSSVTNSTSANSALASLIGSSGSGGATASSNTPTTAAAESQQFLTLLVAQLNNQDPMNPMDNAQMTSQIAQINTVQGIQQLNTSITSMAGQFGSMQVLQSASLVGHGVLTSGNTISANGTDGMGAVTLGGAADNVTVQLVSPGGTVMNTYQVGPMAAGNNNFDVDLSQYTGGGTPTFTVTATNAGKSVTATPLVRNTVSAVGNNPTTNALTLTLSGGTTVPYSSVVAIQ